MIEVLKDLLLPKRRQTSALDRLISEAGRAHIAARRALALAVAAEDREIGRRGALAANVTDLEGRAIDALKAGREDLATRAAEAIAVIETEIAASEAASIRFAAKVALTRRAVDDQRRRLSDLDRGRRLAHVGAALNESSGRADGVPLLARAEAASSSSKPRKPTTKRFATNSRRQPGAWPTTWPRPASVSRHMS